MYNINALQPLIDKKLNGTLTIEEILDNTDALNDLRANPLSVFKD